MRRAILLGLMAVAVHGLSGCKFVFKHATDEAAIPYGPDGDDPRNSQRIAQTFEPQLVPFIRENALRNGELRSLMADDLGAAGRRVSFVGITPMKSATGTIVVTPIDVTFLP